MAFAAVRTLVLLAPPEVPQLALVAVDGRVLALALGLAAVVGCVFGLVPLVQSRRTDLQAALIAEDTRGAAGGRGTSVARSSLVVAELALAAVLVSSRSSSSRPLTSGTRSTRKSPGVTRRIVISGKSRDSSSRPTITNEFVKPASSGWAAAMAALSIADRASTRGSNAWLNRWMLGKSGHCRKSTG